MKELELKDIQSISLEILKDIHSFCEKNKIEYSIIGGSLIGAVRHKGFIPWDDDIDIMMPRDEYERFCTSYNSSRFKLLSLHNDKSCKIAYARVCDMEDTLVLDQAWTTEKVGVSIDIFPFDGAEDNFEQFKNHYISSTRIWGSLFLNRALSGGIKPTNGSKLNFAIKVLSMFHLTWVNGIIARNKVKKIDKRAKAIPFGKTKHVSQFAFLEPGVKEYFDLGAFKEYVKLPFEDIEVNAIAGYDHYLSRFYGDYMKFPPEEERVPKQNYVKFVWKDKC